MKVSVQMMGIIGISVTIGGYLALTDWQTIPYDPCTQYSPYHNPDMVQNLTKANVSVLALGQTATTGDFGLYTSLNFRFDNGFMQSVKIPLGLHGHCTKTTTCDCYSSSEKDKMCLTFISENSDKFNAVPLGSLVDKQKDGYDTYQCLLFSHTTICILKQATVTVPSHESNTQAVIGTDNTRKELTRDQLTRASDKCINADIPNHICHWIPYKQLQNGVCRDCPPICRSTHRTLHIAQIVIGSSLLLIGYSMVWFTALAISTNLAMKKCQV